MPSSFVRWLLLVTVCLFAIAQSVLSSSENDMLFVSDHPESRNVSFNDEVTFNCAIRNADVLIWLLDDDTIEERHCVKDFQITYRNGQILSGNLTLPSTGCTTSLNQTNVTCSGISTKVSPYVVYSHRAMLMLQGLVESPTAINATPIGDQLRVSWRSPFVLDGITISHYRITFNLSDGSTYGPITTTNMEFAYSLANTTHVDNVTVCVNAMTAAGRGDSACNTTFLYSKGSRSNYFSIQTYLILCALIKWTFT